MTDLEWLRELESEINAPVDERRRLGLGPLAQRRTLSSDEWARVESILRRERLVIVPFNAGMGFNFGIAAFEIPAYPNLPLERVIHVEGGHLGMRFAEAWSALSPLSHCEKNRELLAIYGDDEAIVAFHGSRVELRERVHYEY